MTTPQENADSQASELVRVQPHPVLAPLFAGLEALAQDAIVFQK